MRLHQIFLIIVIIVIRAQKNKRTTKEYNLKYID